MVADTKENTRTEGSQDLVSTPSMMSPDTKATGRKMCSTGLVRGIGQMDENITASGRRTKCQAMDSISMEIKFVTMVISLQKRRTDLVSMCGQMEGDMRVGGTRAGSMASVRIRTKRRKSRLESGRKESESSGLTT